MKNTVDENIKIIREAIENNKLVVFIGSGVSLNSNYPSWSGLIREFAETIGIHIEKELGTDDFLRIAQYYYNERGAKEYYDCIYKKFNTKTAYNIIHEKILSMNPAHIITTNYDDLIEQAIENSHLVYDVVCEDIDLPYTPNGHLLIKMHGDLKRKNIVLKEDDYLLYSQKFKLIETFVKALFVNHVVLFIGYSLQDMDLKLIMKWVKDILGDHFQRAYFMDADDNNKSAVEINYLKNIGVNIINKTMLSNEYKEMPIDELKSEKGKNIARCINYIMNYENEMTDVIDYFYRKLLIFNDLNRLRFKDVIDAMGIRLNYSVREEGILYVYLNEDSRSFEALVNEFVIQDRLQSDSINCDSINKSKLIKSIFLNANINGIRLLNKDTIEDSFYHFSQDLKSKELNILSLLKLNNYYEINLYCEQTYKPINDHKNNYYNELIRAYANYTMHKYVSAYEIIKKLAKKAYKDKEYIIYYICEFNKKQLIRFIEVPYGFGETVFTEHLNKIQLEAKEESKNLDLRQLYYLLPKKERLSVSCLNDVILNGSYFSDKKVKIAELLKK